MVTQLQKLCTTKLVVEFCMKLDVKIILLRERLALQDTYKRENECLNLSPVLQARFSDAVKNLPAKLSKDLPTYLINLIGHQMFMWNSYCKIYFSLEDSYCINMMRSCFFNSRGVLNKKLIAVEVVKDESLPTTKRLEIACHFSLTEYIPFLWEKLSKNEQLLWFEEMYNLKKFINKVTNGRTNKYNLLLHTNRYNLLLHTHFLTESGKFIDKDESEVENSVFLDSCIYSYKSELPETFKYSFSQLNSSNKEIALEFIEKNIFSDVIKVIPGEPAIYFSIFGDRAFLEIFEFLLFELSSKQLQKLFLSIDLNFLQILLIWPCQYLFLKMAEMFMDNIKKVDFYILLMLIIHLIEDPQYGITYDYRLLFCRLWNMGSSNLKRFVLYSETGETYINTSEDIYTGKTGSLIENIFRFSKFSDDDKYLIQLILEDASADVKQKIIDKQGNYICRRLLSSGNVKLVDVFVDCCVPNEKLGEFKRNLFENYSDYILDQLKENDKMGIADDVIAWLSDH